VIPPKDRFEWVFERIFLPVPLEFRYTAGIDADSVISGEGSRFSNKLDLRLSGFDLRSAIATGIAREKSLGEFLVFGVLRNGRLSARENSGRYSLAGRHPAADPYQVGI